MWQKTERKGPKPSTQIRKRGGDGSGDGEEAKRVLDGRINRFNCVSEREIKEGMRPLQFPWKGERKGQTRVGLESKSEQP